MSTLPANHKQNLGEVLYKNMLSDRNTTLAGWTVAMDAEIENISDSMDFSSVTFSHPAYLDVSNTADFDVDSMGIYATVLEQAAVDVDIEIRLETGVGTGSYGAILYSKNITVNNATEGRAQTQFISLESFTPFTVPAGYRVEITTIFTTGTEIKINQISLGEKLEFPIGQWAGMRPSSSLQGIAQDLSISSNGSILPRSARQIERTGEIMLSPVGREFVVGDWRTFTEYAFKENFFYKWSPLVSEFEDDVSFCSGEIVPPSNVSQNRFECKMPIVFKSPINK